MAPGNEKIIEKGKQQYIIAPRKGSSAVRAGIRPLSADQMKGLIDNIRNVPGVEVVRTIRPKKVMSPLSLDMGEANETYVVKMDFSSAELLTQTALPHLIVEQDRFLSYGGMVRPSRAELPDAVLRSTQGFSSVQIKFRIVGEGDTPLPNAKVTLQGDAFAQDGVTDNNGEVTLTLHTIGEHPPRSLFVDPPKDYWDRFIITPNVSHTDVNVIRMKSLRDFQKGFPTTFKYGWGQKLMGLDHLEKLTGKGVKIAIIDSGADNGHTLLRHIKSGMDLTNNRDNKTWVHDVIGHGTHCAGIIAARSDGQIPFRGFAPEAEIHIFKIFPSGMFSNLLDALDECMVLDIDIVNMSLGSDYISQAVEQKLEEAVLDGIACIVAAGNSGGPVQYPASSPNVLAVSAIGKLNEYPSESWDERTVVSSFVASDGTFSPSFTCFGPQIAVSAPGVSIISTIPDNGFEPQSGTSMAAPHVAGFAALLLSHHSAFRDGSIKRGPRRIAALFDMIKSSCSPSLLDPLRVGRGIPNLVSSLREWVEVTPQEAATEVLRMMSMGGPAKPIPATGSAPATSPQLSIQIPPPPAVNPYLWQTVIWPQVAALLAMPGGGPLLLQLTAQGAFGPQLSSILGNYISILLSQAQPRV